MNTVVWECGSEGAGEEGVHLQDGMQSPESGIILEGDRLGRRKWRRGHGLEKKLRVGF